MQTFTTARVLICLFAAFLLGASSEIAAQQGLKPRAGGTKMSLDQLRALPQSNQVVVKFRQGQSLKREEQNLTGLREDQSNLLKDVLSKVGVSEAAMKPLYAAPPSELDRERKEAERRSGRELADLSLYVVIELPKGVSAAEVADNLNALSFVEFARPGLRPAPLPVFNAPKALCPAATPQPGPTPNLASKQGYKGKAPRGIGLIPSVPGSDGKGVSFVDIEYGWRLDHEDLESPPVQRIDTFISEDPEDLNHGAAVLGIISGNLNAFGVTGIAPGATAMVAPAFSPDGDYHPARTIRLAMDRLELGDVIVVEQQTEVCGTQNDLGPLEYWDEIFDVVQIATSKGIIVLAAAGNGRDNGGPGYNLDDLTCERRFDRNHRDSGAIIVGAGSSVNRSRLDFSSYGSRVDLQGWGERVTTTGYGDAFPSDDPRRCYTKIFDGTSSATPIVAGAVLVIQGIRKACGLPPATPSEMRDLLARTGSPQGQPRSTHIGPLPNIEAALKSSVPTRCLSEPKQL